MTYTAELFRFVRNALIEALRNGESEPFSIDCSPNKLRKTINFVAKHVEEICIEIPRLYGLFDEVDYYLDPENFLYIVKTKDNNFVIRSLYKEYIQKLKQSFDNKLQQIEQEYNELHPIEGWNSEYDEFME